MAYTRDDIITALKTVFDPEIPVNVYDLGLIYDIEIRKPKTENQEPGLVNIKMTLTSPTCPMADDIILMVRQSVGAVVAPDTVSVELVWNPPWDLNRMSDAARLELDLTSDGW